MDGKGLVSDANQSLEPKALPSMAQVIGHGTNQRPEGTVKWAQDEDATLIIHQWLYEAGHKDVASTIRELEFKGYPKSWWRDPLFKAVKGSGCLLGAWVASLLWDHTYPT